MLSILQCFFITFVLLIGNFQVYADPLNLTESACRSLQHKKPQQKPSQNRPVVPYVYNPYVPIELWDSLTGYFLPEDHPIKLDLDVIFSSSRATENIKGLINAGFKDIALQKYTHIVVARHPQVPGYFFKFYLDNQKYFCKKPEHHFWKLRINGAKIIQNYIDQGQLSNLFKVPKKWIYPLPIDPSPDPKLLRKNFILVEEDMNIYNKEMNEYMWGTSAVTKALLINFFCLVSNLGLADCCKPANAPFSKDGRVAFVDTQQFYSWPVVYYKLTQFLSPEMVIIWNEMTGVNKQD